MPCLHDRSQAGADPVARLLDFRGFIRSLRKDQRDRSGKLKRHVRRDKGQKSDLGSIARAMRCAVVEP